MSIEVLLILIFGIILLVNCLRYLLWLRYEARRAEELREFALAEQLQYESEGTALLSPLLSDFFLYGKGLLRTIRNMVVFESSVSRRVTAFDFMYIAQKPGTKRLNRPNTAIIVSTETDLHTVLICLERPLLTMPFPLFTDKIFYLNATSHLGITSRFVYIEDAFVFDNRNSQLREMVERVCSKENCCLEIYGRQLLLWIAESNTPISELVALATELTSFAEEHLRTE